MDQLARENTIAPSRTNGPGKRLLVIMPALNEVSEQISSLRFEGRKS